MRLYLNVIECAIEHNDKFLVIEHPSGGYAEGLLSFPGGKVDPADESYPSDILRAAVKREIFEEVGLTLIDPIEYVFSTFFVGKNDSPIINSTFYCRLNKSLPTVTISPKEIAKYAWLTPKEIMNAQNASSWIKDYVQRIETYKALKTT
ncbi:MAG: NUDIX hydrolase [Alphaproteobacteria bacterium]|nr:NUDIX hydrolase [Alphaproteobacteria bacterium]